MNVHPQIPLTKLLLLFAALLHLANASIDSENLINSHRYIFLKVYDENQLKLINLNRVSKPTLKFSLHGATIEKIVNLNSSSWSLILGDNSTVSLTLDEKPDTTEYDLIWFGGGSNTNREICFHYAFNHAHWYNGYSSLQASWPMNTSKAVERQHFNYLFDRIRYRPPRADYEHTGVLEQLFVNSDGFAVVLDQNAPWFIRRLPTGDSPLLCFSVDNAFPYDQSDKSSSYLDIKLHLFTSKNIRTVTDYVVHQSGLIPAPLQAPPAHVFTHPTWIGIDLQAGVEAMAQELIKHGLASQSLLFPPGEGTEYLDDMIKPTQYPEDSLITALHQQGFSFGQQFYETYLEAHGPTKAFTIKGTNYTDFSNPDACKLLASKLTNFRLEKQVDAFLLSLHFELYTKFQLNSSFVQKYPSLLATRYIETANQAGATIITELGYKTQHLPVLTKMSLFPGIPYEQALRELIPNVLSVSMAGYPFVMPFSAGYSFWWLDRIEISEELYIRMLQANALMPAMSITKFAWEFPGERAVNLTQRYVQLHAQHAPTIRALAEERIKSGQPIVRPMWYIAPDDPKTYTIGDQFLLGNDILVAPVVTVRQRERSVYLPTGVWIDQHGKQFSGPAEVKVAAPLEELPYFKRKI